MDKPINIANQRQLFVDDLLISLLTGAAALELKQPEPQEVVLDTTAPWEGNTCAYYTLFRDGDIFRMYYRGSHFLEQRNCHAAHEVVCYAQSNDGVHWVRPELDLVAFNGSTNNNIIWDGTGGHNFTPFLDRNPQCRADSRYKALGRALKGEKHGLYAFHSQDGLHWSKMAVDPVITQGAFDSQNLAFWDAVKGCYISYFREYRDDIRDIMVTRSHDFLNWSEPQFLQYPGTPDEHLYTNAIFRYPRAPQYLLGFPTRYFPDTEQVEPLFMSSRDGVVFSRWPDPVIPFSLSPERAGNRSNYIAWGLLDLPDREDEFSVYASEAYYRGASTQLRRFSYRLDGFVALRAIGRGEMVTHPLVFKGNGLEANFVTSGNGGIEIEVQTPAGDPVAGLSAGDCARLRGDCVAGRVRWDATDDLGGLAGRPVRLRILLEDAALYSFRFDEF